jgi:hypothetical protein
MIQIGAQMTGRNVVCPQCGERITVPTQSVPQAEALYQFLKRKRIAEKTGRNLDLPLPTRQPEQPLPPTGQPVVTVQEKRQNKDEEKPSSLLEDFEADEVDCWIAEFWATNPSSESGNLETKQRVISEPAKSAVSKTFEEAAVTVRHRQTLALFRTWLLVVFLLGFIGGLCTYSFFAGFRKKTPETTGSTKPKLPQENIVTGKLFYRGFDGERLPDADAVVLLLPQDRIPAFPISSEGIRPGDTQSESVGDAVSQIEEIGGFFQRTGIDGTFSIPYKKEGRYLALMISSHAKRSEPDMDTVTFQKLQYFFRNPKDLIDDFRFIREEYEFEQGKYIVRETF